MVTLQKATFASGCFWCSEAVFQRLKGVETVTSGYCGGTKEGQTNEEVSSGDTGSQEAIQITFDPTVTSYEKLLEIFFKTHDPTTYDRQGADTGSQYRSVIFYHDDDQKMKAEEIIRKLDEGHVFGGKIVTEIKPFEHFYEAEAYHKNFYNRNEDFPYCTVVINPKLEKLYKEFADQIKA